jgi:exodeoxyribonuclease V alpha subunit
MHRAAPATRIVLLDLVACVASVCKRSGIVVEIKYTEEQLQAVKLALESPVSILTGGPGTGKTTVCQKIVEEFKTAKKRVLCAAPTGKASRRLREQTGHPASTIHRLLEWSPRSFGFTRNNVNPLLADAVIVDEVSMVDVALMASLLDAIADGTHLVVVGDADQLPPVGPGSVLRDMIDSGTIPVTRLTVVQRSDSEWLKENANRIVKGDALYLERRNNEDFFFMQREDAEQAVETIVNLVTKIIPRRHKLDPVDDVQVLCPMKKGALGVYNLNAVLREYLNPEEHGLPGLKVPMFDETAKEGFTVQTFRIGDKVMQTRNNYQIGVFNGEVGRISSVDTRTQTAVVTFEDATKEYDFDALRQLQLCYASTVHKSQGSEYPCVILVMHNSHWNMLYRALLYTGVTRAKKVAYIVGNKRGLHQALSNDRPVARRTSLRARIVEAMA